jgi:hypothetical protein
VTRKVRNHSIDDMPLAAAPEGLYMVFAKWVKLETTQINNESAALNYGSGSENPR